MRVDTEVKSFCTLKKCCSRIPWMWPTLFEHPKKPVHIGLSWKTRHKTYIICKDWWKSIIAVHHQDVRVIQSTRISMKLVYMISLSRKTRHKTYVICKSWWESRTLLYTIRMLFSKSLRVTWSTLMMSVDNSTIHKQMLSTIWRDRVAIYLISKSLPTFLPDESRKEKGKEKK